jgi:hypothetical protein
MLICRKCKTKFPIWITIDNKKRNLKNRKYCLNCSPFGLHNTKQIAQYQDDVRKCVYCGETNISKFYGHKRQVCGKCQNQYNKEVGHKKQAFIRDYLGGRCVACGYDKYPSSLDTHHTELAKKDPMCRHMRYWSIDRIKREIETCILLCKNCHAALHCGIDVGIGESPSLTNGTTFGM